MPKDIDIGKVKEQAEQHVKEAIGKVQAGEYLRELRGTQGLSLAQLGKRIGVSAHYLSAVERGEKTMSDQFVRDIAQFYGIDETVIFGLLGRIPLLVKEEVIENVQLQRLIADIKRNKSLDDESKNELLDRMYKLYKEFVEEQEGGN